MSLAFFTGRLLLCLLLSLSPHASHAQEVDPASLPAGSELALRLQRHVERLAAPGLQGREPGTDGNRAAARYVLEAFDALGLRPLDSLDGFRQEITPAIGDNLIGVRPAIAPAAEAPFILVGAHYDHLGNGYLGADDNASGVAVLLEVARELAPLHRHSLLFVAFNAEEQPYIRTPLMGSQHFVDHLPAEIGAARAIKVALIMDMLGGIHWEPLREVVFAIGAEKSPVLYRRLRESIGREAADQTILLPPAASRLPRSFDESDPTSLIVLPLGIHLVEQVPVMGQVAFSDYDAFRNAGVPFLFLSTGRTPRYHSTGDLPDTLHYERMAATLDWVVRLLHRIDADTAPYTVEPDRIELADEVAALRPLAALAADPATEIPHTSFLSRWRLRKDRDWLRDLQPASAGPEAITRLERISMRLQCLLVDFSGCFLF